MTPQLFDVHTNLTAPQFDTDRGEVIAEMKETGIWAITVGTNFSVSKEATTLAEQYEHIFATCGIHPNQPSKGQLVSSESTFIREEFKELITHPKVVAVGECGLDYVRNDIGDQNEKQRQLTLLEEQVAFSVEHKKPLMLHCRPSQSTYDAYVDMLELLRSHPDAYGDIHFFVGNTDIAKKFLELGFTISFTGVITFTSEYDEIVRYVPNEMIMAETDAPYAAPLPYRGKRNSPLYIEEIVKKMAELRGTTFEEMTTCTVENVARVFFQRP